MYCQVANTAPSANNGAFVPFEGKERSRPLVKTYSQRIVGDLLRLVCALAATGVCWSTVPFARSAGLLDGATAHAFSHTVPVFLVITLLLMFPRSDGARVIQDPAASADVVAPTALAWLLAVGATAPTLLVVPSVFATALLLGILLATCAYLIDAGFRRAIASPTVWPHLARNVGIYGVCAATPRVRDEIVRSRGLRYAGLFEARTPDRVPPQEVTVDGSLDDLVDLIACGRIDEVVVTLPRSAAQRIDYITKRLQQFPVDVHLASDDGSSGPELVGLDRLVTRLGSATLTRVQRQPMRDWDVIVKVIEDRLIGAFLLVALAPLSILIAIAIKLDSAGPVFFRQRRHGASGQTINVWKFRTMRVMENDGQVRQATKHDPRVTAVGRVLRITSLDELPQLINVVLGEMSLVGPRPHAVAHDEYYSKLIESYSGRHQVKPGITGWAQIHGLRGETQEPSEMAKRIEYDIWYIQNWSLLLDLRILLLTPIYGLVHKNAY